MDPKTTWHRGNWRADGQELPLALADYGEFRTIAQFVASSSSLLIELGRGVVMTVQLNHRPATDSSAAPP
jgi:hypothetical protein